MQLRIFSDNCIVSQNKRNIGEKFSNSQILQFSAENILQLFKNRSRRDRIDENYIKFVFCMKNWFWGFIIRLKQ